MFNHHLAHFVEV